MELQGLDENGQIVKARFDDFAKDNAQDGEVFAGVGSTPAHIRYRKGDQFREIDSRELASQAGIKQVQFNFDTKMAKEMNLLQSDVNSGVAYNLERIRSDVGRREYLVGKGRAGVFNNGDDYFAVENGYVKALNNEDGFDWSDVARLGAKAGRDIGAIAGVAAVGAGAAATGGAALVAVGAAGAGGAAIGEMGQRLFDKAIGADAAKYNAKLSGAEEVVGAATDVGAGALQAVGGQFASKAIGFAGMKAAQGAAQITEKIGSEKAAAWTANVAARRESGYLASQMPGKWLQSAGSAEEAKAMSILKESSLPGKSTESIKKGISEAKELTSGKMKVPTDPSKEATDIDQAQLQQIFKNKTAQQEAQKAEQEAADEFSKSTLAEREESFKQDQIQTAKDVFSGAHGELIDKVFSPTVTQNEAAVAAAKVESSFVKSLSKNTGVKIETDSSGRAIRVDDESLVRFTTKKIEQEVDAVASNADKSATFGFDFLRAPTEHEKAFLSGELKNAIGSAEKIAGTMSDKEASGVIGTITRLKNAIDGHTNLTNEDATHAIRQFIKDSREYASMGNLPPSVHNMLENANNAVFAYATENSKQPMMLDMAYAAQSKVLDMKKLIRNEIHGQDGGVEFLVKHLNDMSRIGGDPSGEVASEVAGLWHMKLKLSGGDSSKAFSLMNDKSRLQYSALDAVKNHGTLVPKKASIDTAPAEESLMSSIAKHGFATAVSGAATTAATAVAGPAGMLITAPVYKGALNMASKEGMKKAGSATAKALTNTAKALAKPVGNNRTQGVLAAKAIREATGAEEFMANKLQNFTKSGHNKND